MPPPAGWSARRTANYGKARLPKQVMPSFCDRSVRCDRSEAKAATLHVEAVTAKPVR